MDRISGLSDDLLLKIISFLPTKDAVFSSILSKRWECLWLWLPKLDYITKYHYYDYSPSECESLGCFLNRKLPLHRAPIIESFRLGSGVTPFKPEDIKLWVAIVVSRQLRELEISYINYPDKRNILPSSLYNCKSLVTLKLRGGIHLDVPRMVCLPSLKTLQLIKTVDLDGESLGRLLSICPVLENLWLDFYVSSGKIIVMVPSLQSLSFSSIHLRSNIDELEIETPSLKYLILKDYNKENHPFSIGNMPQLEEAFVDVRFLPDFESLLGSITSVKCLTLCSKALFYGNSFVFNQLEHLKLCDCGECWSTLLARFLRDSPNLRVLDIFKMVGHNSRDMVGWNEPSSVPEHFMSKLQTFSWSGYLGRPQERDVAVYILKNSRGLKTATISPDETFVPKYEMIKELSRSSRASATCQLIFD